MKYNGPQEFRPISAWGYFLLEILYSIPVIGFIFLIVHAIGASNVNRRSFARSYFVIFVVIFAIVLVVIFSGIGASLVEKVTEYIQSVMNQ